MTAREVRLDRTAGERAAQAPSVPFISVVIPHLNQPQQLGRCLQSLSAQSYDPAGFEIIVVDNGSRRLPSSICSDFLGVRLEVEATPGPGPARNKGVGLARGEILAFIDADCIAERDWLAAIARALAHSDGPPIIGGDVRIAVKDAQRLTPLEAYESVFAYRQQEYIELQGFSGTGNLAMRRDVYWAVGPFAGINVAEDRDWGRRATQAGYAIRYLPDMVVRHPARQSFRELYAKWDRHIDHDFAECPQGVVGGVAWGVKAVLVAVSPLTEIGRVFGSRRLSSRRERWLAIFAVTKIRLYRAAHMLGSLLGRTGASRPWNRQ